MALNIRNPETEQLAASLARETGESKTEAVTKALKDRLARVKQRKARRRLADELDEIGKGRGVTGFGHFCSTQRLRYSRRIR